ncbi:anaphase-promoting complex, cyclosome, subunit 4-domain-containing protein [Mrakia frigida]|uniref:anaphase-promoting complex, cyclosome, subunit 4-domain-containing protein n=1 Tax=Mrakia frigida TaxID=29902 RepID=UPI003FCBF55C
MSQQALLSLNSFTPLSTISLPNQSHLHPQACSPTMDILALVNEGGKDSSADKVTLSLWRLAGGPKVWGVEMPGRVAAMGWSFDGLYLAVKIPGKLLILSVHDGSTVREVVVPTTKGKERALEGEFFDGGATVVWEKLEDESTGSVKAVDNGPGTKKRSQDEERTGSAFGIINSLPLVSPLEASPAASTSSSTPFLATSLPSVSSSLPPPSHPLLTPPLPSLLHSPLPPNPPTPPPLTLLTLNSHLPFLSGSFPLPPLPVAPLLSPPPPNGIKEETMQFARGSSAVEELLRGAVVGLGRLEDEWFGKGGASQAGKDWIKVFKDVGARFGVHADPSADFTKLLITGARRGEGTDTISQFLGGRLTERSLLKWEATVTTALTTIRQACYQTLLPAFERIILLLNEMRGWSLWRSKYGSLALQSAELQRAINLTRYAAFRVRELEREAAEEGRRFTEFAKWLRYEVSVATTEDSSSEPSHPPTHDVLLVADYLQTSFIQSRIDTFFQSPPISPPPPPILIPAATPTLPTASLFATIASTIRPLANQPSLSSSGGRHVSTEPEGASGKNKTKMLSPVLARRGLPRLSVDGMEVDGEDGTGGGEKRDHGILEVAGELVGLLRKVFGSALGSGAGLGEGEGSRTTVPGGELVREWSSKIEGGASTNQYVALITNGLDQLSMPCFWLMSTSSTDLLSVKMAYFQLQLELSEDQPPSTVQVLDMNFFNDDEIVLVLSVGEEEESKILLCSIAYTSLECFSVPLPPNSPSPVTHVVQTLDNLAHTMPPSPLLPLSRCRHLSSLDRMPRPTPGSNVPPVTLALNGRPGRMTGSLMVWGGREVEVFDLEEDEGNEEEEEEEGGEGEGGEGEMEE